MDAPAWRSDPIGETRGTDQEYRDDPDPRAQALPLLGEIGPCNLRFTARERTTHLEGPRQPICRARRTASFRPDTPSLAWMCSRWVFTVSTET